MFIAEGEVLPAFVQGAEVVYAAVEGYVSD